MGSIFEKKIILGKKKSTKVEETCLILLLKNPKILLRIVVKELFFREIIKYAFISSQEYILAHISLYILLVRVLFQKGGKEGKSQTRSYTSSSGKYNNITDTISIHMKIFTELQHIHIDFYIEFTGC